MTSRSLQLGLLASSVSAYLGATVLLEKLEWPFGLAALFGGGAGVFLFAYYLKRAERDFEFRSEVFFSDAGDTDTSKARIDVVDFVAPPPNEVLRLLFGESSTAIDRLWLVRLRQVLAAHLIATLFIRKKELPPVEVLEGISPRLQKLCNGLQKASNASWDVEALDSRFKHLASVVGRALGEGSVDIPKYSDCCRDECDDLNKECEKLASAIWSLEEDVLRANDFEYAQAWKKAEGGCLDSVFSLTSARIASCLFYPLPDARRNQLSAWIKDSSSGPREPDYLRSLKFQNSEEDIGLRSLARDHRTLCVGLAKPAGDDRDSSLLYAYFVPVCIRQSGFFALLQGLPESEVVMNGIAPLPDPSPLKRVARRVLSALSLDVENQERRRSYVYIAMVAREPLLKSLMAEHLIDEAIDRFVQHFFPEDEVVVCARALTGKGCRVLERNEYRPSRSEEGEKLEPLALLDPWPLYHRVLHPRQ